jgi:hypothetical protein
VVVDATRLQVRARLQSGTLPRVHAASTHAGASGGTHRCAVCDDFIDGPIEFRLRFPDGLTLRFHARCRDAWLTEREALDAT